MTSLRKRTFYPSDLTDAEWKSIRHLIPRARRGGRPRTTDVREVVNAIFYLTRSGCAWRYLPQEFPPWRTIYDYFSVWNERGVWRAIHQELAARVRRRSGRKSTPSTVIIDGQCTRAQYGEERGWDGFKKVRGRKRQILVDSTGILWGAWIHRANQQEPTYASKVIEDYPRDIRSPQRVLGDSAYGGKPFANFLAQYWSVTPVITRGTKVPYYDSRSRIRFTVGKSNLKPQRWVVERTFAWFNNFRRLNRDYEKKVSNSKAFLFISQIPLLLKRLNQNQL